MVSTEQLAVVEQRIANESKSSALAYVLWFFLGTLGIHNFYIGRTERGIAEFALLMGGSFLWGAFSAFARRIEGGGGAIFLVIPVTCWITWTVMWLIDLFIIPNEIKKYRDRLRAEYLAEFIPQGSIVTAASPLSIRTPTTYYRGYTYFWHENGIKLPLKGEATKHFANEQEAKTYIDSLTTPPISCSPVTSKTQETTPSSAVAPGVTSGAIANWIGGLPAWPIGLFGLVFSFLVVSLFLFSSSPNPPRSTAIISGSASGTSRSTTVQSSTGNNGESILGGIARPSPVHKDYPPPGQRFWVSPQ
jgi:TM2 domain-containing protein